MSFCGGIPRTIMITHYFLAKWIVANIIVMVAHVKKKRLSTLEAKYGSYQKHFLPEYFQRDIHKLLDYKETIITSFYDF